ncbi:hypothetical protein DQ04_02311000 [Trypanosoma grayi]|uniref:hypothetical protein n=1 Tax=Trypanosoma grayi TaxID=71804 RepID=UPI0004F44168|nr:hypothetical protein DQ04_02311000 [Trypanosoma grayi]KEG11748.1 hypothetical protein DQ04_02311000 [Trypanosoma grayi]
MFSSQFDDNPFAEDAGGESTLSDIGDTNDKNTNRDEKRQRDDTHAADEPPKKVVRHDDASDENIHTKVDEMEAPVEATETTTAPPYTGYAMEDTEEGVCDSEDNYSSQICRVAELEATQRQTTRSHRFRLTLARQENEALRTYIGRLRMSLMEMRQRPQKGGSHASGFVKEAQPQAHENPSALSTMMDAYDSTARGRRLASHVHWLQHLESVETNLTQESCATTVDSESWMPALSPSWQGVAPCKPSSTAVHRLENIQKSLKKLLPVLDAPTAQVVTTLVWEIQRLSEKSDALGEVVNSLESQVQALRSRWKDHILWGTERGLLVAEEQMSSHLAALCPTSTERQLFHQKQQLQKRLHRAEVAIGVLLSAATGVRLQSVSPATLQAALQRQEELEKLRDQLSREVLYLRKMLWDKFSSSPLSVLRAEVGQLTKETTEEGRVILLQHCCAALSQQLTGLTHRIISKLLRGSTACPSSAEQSEQLLACEEELTTLHASIVAFLTENARIQQEIKDLSLVKVLAAHGSAALIFFAERLQMPFLYKQPVGEEMGNGNNEGDNSVEGNEEELDAQKILADTFMKNTECLVGFLNTHMKGVMGLFTEEKKLCGKISFLLRMAVAADRLLFRKVGVLLSTAPTGDIAKELDEVRVCFEQPQHIPQDLPPLDALQNVLQSHSSRHAKELLNRWSAADKAREKLQEDLDWCSQQYPRHAASELREAQRELQQLKASVAAVETRTKDTAPLEVELKSGKEKLAQLQQEQLALQKELAAAEEEWRLVEENERAKALAIGFPQPNHEPDEEGNVEVDEEGSAEADEEGSAEADEEGSAEADEEGSVEADEEGSAEADEEVKDEVA